jgi:hypothetical protein
VTPEPTARDIALDALTLLAVMVMYAAVLAGAFVTVAWIVGVAAQ